MKKIKIEKIKKIKNNIIKVENTIKFIKGPILLYFDE